jgi:ribosomal protein L7/L12
MSAEEEVNLLRARVVRLEKQMELLYTRLGLPYQEDTETIDRPVLEALNRGDKMKAIQAYREIHKVDLNEALKAVTAMGAKMGQS